MTWIKSPRGRWRLYRRPDGQWLVEGYFPRSEGGKYWCYPATKVERYLWQKLFGKPARPAVAGLSE